MGNSPYARRMEDAREWARWWRLRGLAEMQSLLWDHWDPLGLASVEDWPRDEYDSYAGVLASKLRRGNSRADIAIYLATKLTESAPSEAELGSGGTTADVLIAWYAASDAPGR